MIIRYAGNNDYTWLKKYDNHINDAILKMKIDLREIYIAQENTETTGWLRYNLFWDEIPFMNMLYVLENYREKGIGRKLAEHWENEMKNKGHTTALTSTRSDEKAQHFYRKIGYTEIGGFKYLEEPYEIIFHKILK
jgi:ribosomal protein S18 acetylase RimI-like enzyme